jgi:hypothetical protein
MLQAPCLGNPRQVACPCCTLGGQEAARNVSGSQMIGAIFWIVKIPHNDAAGPIDDSTAASRSLRSLLRRLTLELRAPQLSPHCEAEAYPRHPGQATCSLRRCEAVPVLTGHRSISATAHELTTGSLTFSAKA